MIISCPNRSPPVNTLNPPPSRQSFWLPLSQTPCWRWRGSYGAILFGLFAVTFLWRRKMKEVMIYEGVIHNRCHSLCVFGEKKKPGWSCKLMDRRAWKLRLDNFGLEIYGNRKATSGTKKSGNRTTNDWVIAECFCGGEGGRFPTLSWRYGCFIGALIICIQKWERWF